MSSSLYRSFLRLLEKWPLDELKKGRDLGEYIRSGIGVSFRGGSNEPKNREKCQEIFNRLENIAGNKYKQAFYCSDLTTASGLGQSECRELVSSESLKLFEEEDKTMREKLSGYFRK